MHAGGEIQRTEPTETRRQCSSLDSVSSVLCSKYVHLRMRCAFTHVTYSEKFGYMREKVSYRACDVYVNESVASSP